MVDMNYNLNRSSLPIGMQRGKVIQRLMFISTLCVPYPYVIEHGTNHRPFISF